MFADISFESAEPRFEGMTAPFVLSPDGRLAVSDTRFDAMTGLLSVRVRPTDRGGRATADLVVTGLDPTVRRTVLQDGAALPQRFSFRPTGPGWMATSSGTNRVVTTPAEHRIVVG